MRKAFTRINNCLLLPNTTLSDCFLTSKSCELPLALIQIQRDFSGTHDSRRRPSLMCQWPGREVSNFCKWQRSHDKSRRMMLCGGGNCPLRECLLLRSILDTRFFAFPKIRILLKGQFLRGNVIVREETELGKNTFY